MADDDYTAEDLESAFELPRLKFLKLNAGDTRSLNAYAYLARHIQSPWRTRVNIALTSRTPLQPDLHLVVFMCLSYRVAHVVHSALGAGRLGAVHLGWCNAQFFLHALSTDGATGAADVVLHTAVPSTDTPARAWRRSAEQLFTARARGCDLCCALALAVHNLGTAAAPWRALVSAMEGALRAHTPFMPRLAALTVNRFPASARAQAGFGETDVDLHGGEEDCGSVQTDEEIMAQLRKRAGVLCELGEPGMAMRFGRNMQRGLFD